MRGVKKKTGFDGIKILATLQTPKAKAAIATGKVTKEYLETLEEKEIDFLISKDAVKAYGIKEVTPEKLLKLEKEQLGKIVELKEEANSIEEILNKARAESAKERLKSFGILALRTVGILAAVAAISSISLIIGGILGMALLAVSVYAAVLIEKVLINEFKAEIEEQAGQQAEVEAVVAPFVAKDEPQKSPQKTREEITQEIIDSISRSPSPTLIVPNLERKPIDRDLSKK